MELKSMLSCCLQTLHCALNRRESRGCHARSDFQVTINLIFFFLYIYIFTIQF